MLNNFLLTPDFLNLVSIHPQTMKAAMQSLLQALLLVAIGWWLGRRIGSIVRHALVKLGADALLLQPAANITSWAIRITAGIMALGKLGMQTSSIMALLGAAGLAIGLALQGTLQNIAAGVMLMVFRPFHIGDLIEIESGKMGTIKHIGFFMSVFARVDGASVYIPNSKLWGASISGYSMNGARRQDLSISIRYSDNVKAATDAILSVLAQNEGVLKDREQLAVVDEYADSAVILKIRFWTTTQDYWPTKWAVLSQARIAIEAAGCQIPFPVQEIHFQATDRKHEGLLPPKNAIERQTANNH